MIRTCSILLLVLCAGLTGAQAAGDPLPGEAEPVQVMVLGTYHFAGSDSDLINVETDSVLTARRQAELQAVAEALTAFKPTVIVTERVTEPPDYRDPVFEAFDEAMLATKANERVQLGYRLARTAGVSRVYGLDEQPADGEPDYFPFGALMAHAERTGTGDELKGLLQAFEQAVKAETDEFARLSMARVLQRVNSGLLSSADQYYRLLKLDTGEEQPAAELNAYWFMRNAKIFSKLEDVTRPGDRVIVVYGAGHKHWLDHLVAQTPGFETVDPIPYMAKAD